jgi:hypothetical protein
MAESKGIRDAFDEAVSAFIAWDRHGTEPTVILNNVPIPISTLAGLIKDPMPREVLPPRQDQHDLGGNRRPGPSTRPRWCSR